MRRNKRKRRRHQGPREDQEVELIRHGLNQLMQAVADHVNKTGGFNSKVTARPVIEINEDDPRYKNIPVVDICDFCENIISGFKKKR